ncbi:hypothetical protein Plec18170_006863 [Paecilomyces lecythidis]
MSKSEKKRKCQKKLLEKASKKAYKQGHTELAAELASQGIVVLPEEDTKQIQVDIPVQILTPGQ